MKNKSSRIESFISIILLLPLLILLTILINFYFNSPLIKQSSEQDIVNYKINNSWQYVENWLTLPENRIYEKINGRVTLFKEFGVAKLEYCVVKTELDEVEINIYTMKDNEGAFGVFSQEAPKNSEKLEDYEIADISNGLLRFVKGNKYAVFLPMTQNIESTKLLNLADDIFSSIEDIKKDEKKEINITQIFPKENLIEGSILFNKTETIGLISLKNIYSAKYNIDNTEVLLLLQSIDKIDINTFFNNVQNEIIDFGGTDINKEAKSLSAFFFDKYIVIKQIDNLIIGIYTEMNHEDSQNLIDDFYKKIKDNEK